MKIIKFQVNKEEIQSVCTYTNLKEWEVILNQARKEAAANLDIKGFRKGKIPINLVDKYIKSNDLLNKAAVIAERKSYELLLLDHKETLSNKYRLLSTSLNKVSFSDFQITHIWQKLPTIVLDKWKDFSSEVDEVKVTEEEINLKIDTLRDQLADFVSKNDNAAKGDYLLINYRGEVNKKVDKRISAENFRYSLGNAKFGIDFDNNLLNAVKNTEKEFTVQLPENYLEKDLSNQKIKFTVKILDVQIRKPLSSDQELISKLGSSQIKTLDDLKKIIAQSLKQNKVNEIHPKILKQVWEQLLSKVKVDIPERYLIEETKAMKTKYVENLLQKNENLDSYLKKSKQSEKDFDTKIKKKVQKMLTDYLIIREVSEREKLTVKKEEVDQYYNFLVKNQNEKIEDIKKKYPETLLFHNLLRYKVEQFLVNNTLEFNGLNGSQNKKENSKTI